MLRVILHIERLLLEHDCVIVPGFGGFISQSVSATLEKNEHLFIPPRKEISFNATLHHSDGLLAESYMQLYNIDYNQAQQMLNDDVEEMKNDLKRYNKLSMGIIGTITLGEEGQIMFTPSETKLFSVSSYGLTDLNLLPLSSLIEEKKKEHQDIQLTKKKDTLYIPVSRKFIRLIASTAAAIAAFLLISTPIAEVNKDSYKASFIPYEVVKPTVQKQKPTVITLQETRPVQPVIANPAPVAKVSKTEVKAVKKSIAKTAPAVKTSPNPKMFHAIIGSFPNKEQAEQYMKSVDRNQFASANIIVRNNKYRVYAKRFTNRKEANDYINSLHNNTKYKDAWLFISR